MKKWTINRSLLPLKLILFFYHGAAACILPYLSVHMRSIGITVEETAIIYAILPVVGFVGPPIAGFFADRLGRYQPVLITSLVATAVFINLLLVIPPMSTEVRPAEVHFTCHHGGAIVHVERCPETACSPWLLSNDTDLELAECRRHCLSTTNKMAVDQSNMADEQSMIADQQANFTDAGINSSATRPHVQMHVWDDSHRPHELELSTLDVSLFDLSLSGQTELTCEYELDHFLWRHLVLTNMTCPQLDAVDCVLRCSVLVPATTGSEAANQSGSGGGQGVSERLNYPLCSHFVGNHLLTFSMYFLVRVISGVFISVCFSMLDATCFAMIADKKAEYGRQKIYSILATAIFSPITGLLIDHMSDTKGIANYAPAFYVFDGLIALTIVVAYNIRMEMETSSRKMMHNIRLLLRRAEVVAFFLTIALLGTMWGFLETFLFWYMLDLHSPKYLLGLTVTIGSGLSIPVLFWAEKIVKKAGNINLLILAFAVYSIRMVGYSFIQNPWWSLAFESLEVITISLMWVAAATYGTSIAPKGLLATIQGAMGAMHYGIGRGVGSFVGGLLMKDFGAKMAFRVMGVGSAVCCVTASIFYLSYFRCRKTECDYDKDDNTDSVNPKVDTDCGQLEKMLPKEEHTELKNVVEFEEKRLPAC